MSKARHCLLPLISLLALQAPQAAELTGRFSMLGATGQAEAGDVGYADGSYTALSADQQSLRLMLDGLQQRSEWSLHLDTSRLHLDGYPPITAHSSQLFRYRPLAGSWLDESGERSSTHIGYVLDRAFYRHSRGNMAVALGRQPIDWGSGRFWQPFNVFGAFAPAELDTDFKPGIDGMTLDWYPSAFSSLTAAWVVSPHNRPELNSSGALHYRRQVGTLSELKLLAGSVLGNRVLGASLESQWRGMGWRIEGVHYRLEPPTGSGNELFWIAGIDYQFTDGTLLLAEWYHNSRGAQREEELSLLQADPLIASGLQPHLGRDVAGLGLERDLTPLLHGGYLLLLSGLEDREGGLNSSLMHQINLSYSVSNESDLLLSLLWGEGKGLDVSAAPRSEFGHLPLSLTLRLRFYF